MVMGSLLTPNSNTLGIKGGEQTAQRVAPTQLLNFTRITFSGSDGSNWYWELL